MRRSLTVALLTILAVPAFAQPAISRLDAFFPSTTSPGGAAITAGTALPNGFTLQITGSGFTSPFVVNWIDNNNAANNTSFSSNAESAFLVDSTTIQVPSIPPALVATATSITVQVVIGSSPAASAPFTVNAALPATIPVTGSPVVLPAGVVGGNYAQPLFPTGDGTAPFTISLQSGTLPPGLPVFSPQGTVSPYDNFYVGSPTAAGTYTFRLGIADAWGNSTALPYSLTITPPPVISSLNPPIIPAGSLGFTLTVNGANFVPGIDRVLAQYSHRQHEPRHHLRQRDPIDRGGSREPDSVPRSAGSSGNGPGGRLRRSRLHRPIPHHQRRHSAVRHCRTSCLHPHRDRAVFPDRSFRHPDFPGGHRTSDHFAEPRGPAGHGPGIPGRDRGRQDVLGAESGRAGLVCVRRLHRLSRGRGDQPQPDQPYGGYRLPSASPSTARTW